MPGKKYADLIRELRRSLHVDDLLTIEKTVLQARAQKEKSIEVLDDATSRLHMWHSNVEELERYGEQSLVAIKVQVAHYTLHITQL